MSTFANGRDVACCVRKEIIWNVSCLNANRLVRNGVNTMKECIL